MYRLAQWTASQRDGRADRQTDDRRRNFILSNQ